MKKLLILVSTTFILSLFLAYKLSRQEAIFDLIRYPKDIINKKYVEDIISMKSLILCSILAPAVIMYITIYFKTENWKVSSIWTIFFLNSHSITGLLSELLKVMIGEPRPDYSHRIELYNKTNKDRLNLIVSGSKSFPSGHSSTIFTSVTFIQCLIYHKFLLNGQSIQKKILMIFLEFLLFFIGTAIGIQRILHNKHFVHDVIFGAFIGILCGCIHYVKLANILKKMNTIQA